MLRDEAVAQINQIMTWRSDRTTEIIAGLQFQQQELEGDATLPNFLRKETLALGNTIDLERMAPPADFIREWDDDALWIQITEDGIQKWRALEKDTPKYLRENINNMMTDHDLTEERIPIAYAYDGTDFILFPTPSQVYTYRMIYYAKDDLLTTNIENKWLKHLPYLLIGKAGLVHATAFDNKGAQALFAQFIVSGTKKLNDVSTDRDMAGKKLVIGGPD